MQVPKRLDSIIEIEETLFGEFRVSHRWRTEAGAEVKDVYEVGTYEELSTLLQELGVTFRA